MNYILMVDGRFKRVDIQDKVVNEIAKDIGSLELSSGSKVWILSVNYSSDYCVVCLSSRFPELDFSARDLDNGLDICYHVDGLAKKYES